MHFITLCQDFPGEKTRTLSQDTLYSTGILSEYRTIYKVVVWVSVKCFSKVSRGRHQAKLMERICHRTFHSLHCNSVPAILTNKCTQINLYAFVGYNCRKFHSALPQTWRNRIKPDVKLHKTASYDKHWFYTYKCLLCYVSECRCPAVSQQFKTKQSVYCTYN